MVDVEKLSDAELRTKLLEFGFPVMPITGTTRKVMAKKLKMLMENKNKLNSEGGRRSLGRYSSEEESDTDIKSTKKKDNRRATMAAPVMQPPSNVKIRKSIRLNETPEMEVPNPRELRTTTSTTTTRTQRIVKTAQDEFDTGSESESDIALNNYESPSAGLRGTGSSYRSSPIKTNYSPIKSFLNSSYGNTTIDASGDRYSPPKADLSYGIGKSSLNANVSTNRSSNYNSPSLASEYAADRLNQIRSRLSLYSPGYEKPYTSSNTIEKEETPFLSNFTKRLSVLSSTKKSDDYKNDIIKEHDTNGASSYVRNSLTSFRAGKGRDGIYDYRSNQKGVFKTNFVSFAVLASAALFFIFLAIMYLGMRSNTAVTLAGTIIPHCVHSDQHAKKGINCIADEDVTNAIYLLNAISPELHKRAVAHRCFDSKLKAHMTESEIVNFCLTNFALKDELKVSRDLRNLEILIFNNPEWGISIVQKDDNNGIVDEDDVAKSMENVVFNEATKLTSLVVLKPSLPWRCTFYKTFYLAFNSLIFIVVVFILLYLLNLGVKYYKQNVQKKKDEICFMVEKVINILQSSIGEEGGDNYVVINHVRDMILPFAERKKKENSWNEAVKFINENESRVRTEVQVVQGEPFEVWRWIGSANLSSSGDRTTFTYRQGKRIVDVQYLIKEVLKFPHKRLRFCSCEDVEIKNEIRDGFLSVILLHCSRCKTDYPVCTEEPVSGLMNVNLAFVAGIVSLGLSLHQLNDLCSYLQIPTISGKSYRNYLDEIHDISNEWKEASRDASNFEQKALAASTPKPKKGEVLGTKKLNFLQSLELSPEDIKKLSVLTINQSNDPLWRIERKKRLTASNFGRICKLLESTNRQKVAEDLIFSNFTGNIYTKYGSDNETNAIKDFEKLMGRSVVACGLFVHRRYPYLAASPDGLLDDDSIVEVKCPYKAKDFPPAEAITQKLIQYATFEDGHFRLKRTDKYYFQVQGQLFITEKKFCYFIVWTEHGVLYEKIERDEECWAKMFPKLKTFYFDYLLPVILEHPEQLTIDKKGEGI